MATTAPDVPSSPRRQASPTSRSRVEAAAGTISEGRTLRRGRAAVLRRRAPAGASAARRRGSAPSPGCGGGVGGGVTRQGQGEGQAEQGRHARARHACEGNTNAVLAGRVIAINA